MTLFVELLHSSPLFFVILCGVVGLMVGSFLNVVIHRLPIMMEREWRMQCTELGADAPPNNQSGQNQSVRYNLIIPRSACPHCAHPIGVLENIPVLSYLFLRGTCRNCGSPISIRYPVVEALSGILSAYAAWHFGYGMATFAALLFVWILIALTFIDFDTQLLPDDLTLPLLWLGLMFNLPGLFHPKGTFTDLSSAVIGAVIGYLTLWGVYWLFKFATGKEGMGYGDFKLLAAIGAWLGWQLLPLVILLSSVVGAVVGITLMIVLRQGRNVPIPFGPYLAGGGLIALFWGQSLTQTYLKLLAMP
ncbi:MAG: A24 family peptidase [Candidatus Nitrotoga sp.]